MVLLFPKVRQIRKPEQIIHNHPMQPEINNTTFGSIVVAGTSYDHDIIIRMDGSVEKRKKKLSKAIYGTSHTVSLDEIKYVYEEGAEGIIVGSGQNGVLELSKEAKHFLEESNCLVTILPTPEALKEWNRKAGKYFGLFHVTC